MMPRIVVAFCILHTSRPGALRITCRPSPCTWLSHAPWPVVTPATTMAAPSPWPSRAVGDPVVRRRHTSEAEVGAPLIPLLGLAGQCPSPRRYVSLSVHADARGDGGRQTLLPPGSHVHHWRLGFKQSSFH